MTNKKLLSFTCAALFSAFLIACSDSGTSAKDSFDASVVCPVDGVNAYGEPNRGTFTDERDGRVYKYVTIGKQVWMAENLKFEAPYSGCFSKIENSCDSLGRYYSLYIDGKGAEYEFSKKGIDRALTDTICPAGWHVPTTDDWTWLYFSMGGDEKSTPRLKSTFVFRDVPPGTDDCGFNALPRAWGMPDPEPYYSFSEPRFWTSTLADVYVINTCILGEFGVRFERPFSSATMYIRCVRN